MTSPYDGGYDGRGRSGRGDPAMAAGWRLVMSIGNQEFGIPRKYQYQIGIWYLCLKFLGIFLVFYRNLEYLRACQKLV